MLTEFTASCGRRHKYWSASPEMHSGELSIPANVILKVRLESPLFCRLPLGQHQCNKQLFHLYVCIILGKGEDKVLYKKENVNNYCFPFHQLGNETKQNRTTTDETLILTRSWISVGQKTNTFPNKLPYVVVSLRWGQSAVFASFNECLWREAPLLKR